MMPDELAKNHVFLLMSIGEDDYIWQSNHNGMAVLRMARTLHDGTSAIAKLGMLCLQCGHPNADDVIVTKSFVLNSAWGYFDQSWLWIYSMEC